jgi:hypothetical protein
LVCGKEVSKKVSGTVVREVLELDGPTELCLHAVTWENLFLAALLGTALLRTEQRMSVMTERRTARRYDLSLPVMIRISAERVKNIQQGKTRDISTRGLYFVIDQDLEAGSELDITLTLPAEITHGTEVLVRALGKVVRVENRMEDSSTRMGVAAVIERYDIIRGEAAKA